MLPDLLLLSLCWLLYGVFHSLLASLTVKDWVAARLPNAYRYYRLFYTLFAFITLIAIVIYQLSLPSHPLFRPVPLSNLAGVILGGSGLLLMGICIRKYFLGLSGLLSLVEERPAAELHIRGVHRWVRHPLYLGTFAFLWGWFLLLPQQSLLISNSIITLYTLIGIRLEEKKLLVEFGDAYRQYRLRVPMLLPFRRPVARQANVERPPFTDMSKGG
jgi:protein-S-isoprenylcysteine O-methyltransferase Ste14